jgi:hypothetical protein
LLEDVLKLLKHQVNTRISLINSCVSIMFFVDPSVSLVSYDFSQENQIFLKNMIPETPKDKIQILLKQICIITHSLKKTKYYFYLT